MQRVTRKPAIHITGHRTGHQTGNTPRKVAGQAAAGAAGHVGGHGARNVAAGLAVALALVALVVVGTWQRWLVLASSPFPLGVDGYYYPIQLRALIEDGALHYPASPLTFWFMLPFAVATDPITGAKLAAALGIALAALPAYGVATHLTKQRGAGLVAAAIVTTSATSTFLSIEFVKQGVGLTVALAAVWLVLRALETPSRIRIGVAIAAIAATLLTHKLAAAFVLAVAIPSTVHEARARGLLRGRRLLYTLIGLVSMAIAIVAIGIVAPQRFLSAADLALVRSTLTSEARWDAPALVRPGLVLSFAHEAAIAAALALPAAILLVRRFGADTRPKRGARMVAWCFVLFALVIGLPWLDVSSTQGLGLRLRASAFVPLAICAALVASAIARLLPDPAGWQQDAALGLLAIVLVARAPAERTEGRIVAHPALISSVLAATTTLPEGTTVIVPERHIMFMVAWYTRAPVALRAGTIPTARRVRLLPLHFIGLGSPLDEAIDAARRDPANAEPPIGVHPRHRNGLVIVSERTWQALLSSLPPTAHAYWSRWPTI